MKAPGAKTVVWAANSHVARHELPRGERPIGSHLADAFGDGYVTFALAAHHTEIDFPGFGCGPVRRTPGSIEHKLAVLDEDALLVDTRTRFLRRGNYTMGLDVVRPQRVQRHHLPPPVRNDAAGVVAAVPVRRRA